MKRTPSWPRWLAAAGCTALLGAAGATAAQGGVDPVPAPARELAVCADPANLPYSDDRLQGFENRIAEWLAADLHATLRYTWNQQRRSFLRRTLQSGACDVVLGLPAGLQGVLQTRPYYTSSYVFVSAHARGLKLSGFDDPALGKLRIGLQAVGAEGANPPPAMALARRGLVGRITGYPMWGPEDDETPQARIIDAVARGDIDVAIVWGPFAGYFARRQPQALDLVAIDADPAQPALPFRYAMAAGVRRGDVQLRDALQQALDRRAPQIEALLQSFGIPLVDTSADTDATAASLHARTGTPARARIAATPLSSIEE